MASISRKAIIAALSYAHIFHSALTKKELWKYLILSDESDSVGSKKDFEDTLVTLKKDRVVTLKSSYYALTKCSTDILNRQEHQKESMQKIQIGKNITRVLHCIPTIELISISGSVAAMNAKEDDDIDLFVITSPGSLWITRLLIHGILFFSGRRRGRIEKYTKNKICINMLLDKRSLTLPKSKQNVYTAHEISQIIPLFSRGDTYNEFFQSNNWLLKHLPNVTASSTSSEGSGSSFLITLLRLWEKPVRIFQLWYMRGHRTNEYISDKLVAFHPSDHTPHVLKTLKSELKTNQ